MTDLVVNFVITPLTALSVLNVSAAGMLTTMPVETQTGLTTGDFSFHHVTNGWFSALQYVGNRFRRIGNAGSGMQTMGSAAPDTQFTASASFINDDDALSFAQSLEALPTVACKCQDAWGRTIPRVRFISVLARPRRTAGGSISGEPVINRVDCIFVAERLSDA